MSILYNEVTDCSLPWDALLTVLTTVAPMSELNYSSFIAYSGNYQANLDFVHRPSEYIFTQFLRIIVLV